MNPTRVRPTRTVKPPNAFRADVLAGLSRPQKTLPAKYFYDAAGSALFDKITELPEYYPTRTELGILRRHAVSIAGCCGPRCLLVELGAGSLVKVRLLLDALESPAGFVPVDVSGAHLAAAATELRRDYPRLTVTPVTADFTADFPLPATPTNPARRVAFFPGSTLGNFVPPEANALLRRIAALVGPGGGLVLGIDLRKDPAILERAYDDAAGVTAGFNLNLLTRLNRELAADFDLDTFAHVARYNPTKSRVEMHLRSRVAQTVTVAGERFAFRAGETIHTENSHKYDVRELTAQALACGLRVEAIWTDPQEYFAVLSLVAEPQPIGS